MSRDTNWKLIGILALVVGLGTPSLMLYVAFGNRLDFSRDTYQLQDPTIMDTIEGSYLDFNTYNQVLVERSDGGTINYATYRITLTDQELEDLVGFPLYLPNGTSVIFYGFAMDGNSMYYMYKHGQVWYMNRSPASIMTYPIENWIESLLRIRDTA